MPGILFFLLPVLVAKRDRARSEQSSYAHARIALHDEAAELPSRVRIATDDADPFADEFEADAPPRAARAQHV